MSWWPDLPWPKSCGVPKRSPTPGAGLVGPTRTPRCVNAATGDCSDLAQRIWSLQHNLGAYDACFIALAETLEVPLITCDGMQAVASGHQAEIEAFSIGS